jgi:hypothetical protein
MGYEVEDAQTFADWGVGTMASLAGGDCSMAARPGCAWY